MSEAWQRQFGVELIVDIQRARRNAITITSAAAATAAAANMPE